MIEKKKIFFITKKRGKEIVVTEFLIFIERLCFFDSMLNHQLL